MSIRDNVNQLFQRVSRSSNVKSSLVKYNSYTSLFERNEHRVSYQQGLSILRDSQVATGAEILKYLLSSKKWILTNTDEDQDLVYDFVNEMLTNTKTELGTVVKQMTSAILWGFSVHELIYNVRDGYVVVEDLLPIHIKTLQNVPFVYDDDGELIAIHQSGQNIDVDIPINKCLLYSYNSLYDEKQGDQFR